MIEESDQGFGGNPEYDFNTLKGVDNLTEADSRLYVKTGKLLGVSREIKALKLVVYLDININFRSEQRRTEANKGERIRALIDQIIESFQGEILLEIRNGQNEDISIDWSKEIEEYAETQYESNLESILEAAEIESKQGNIVVIISDWLDFSALSDAYDFNTPTIICVQLCLPTAASDYHKFYIKPFQKPDYFEHRFGL